MSLPEKMIVCPKCNSELPEDSVFCQVCGAELSSVAASAPIQSDLKLLQMFSNVEKWELMGFRRVADRSARRITEQQRQEEAEKRSQSARDVAIQNRIAVNEAANQRKKLIRIIILSIIATVLTILFVVAVIAGVNNGRS